MFRAHRSSSLSSTASSANPVVPSVASSGGSFDRPATLSSLSVRSIAVSASGQQKKDRSAWKRLTRKLSQALGTKKSKTKSLLALPPVQEDPAVHKETQIAAAALIAGPVALVSSQDQSSAEECSSEASVCESAEETEQVSHTKAVSNAERQRESASPVLLELIDTIPVDLPLIRYVAECLLTDAPPTPGLHGEPSKDVESQLFFKSLELKKWTLAQVLAVKIQRRLAFRHRATDDSDKHADKKRIRLGSSAITEDDCDVVLSFLDTCSA